MENFNANGKLHGKHFISKLVKLVKYQRQFRPDTLHAISNTKCYISLIRWSSVGYATFALLVPTRRHPIGKYKENKDPD